MFLIIFFLLKLTKIIFCLKTEINFSINNVPSLFRCQKHGPLFYFNHFPTNLEFEEKSKSCDLVLLSINQRIIIELNRLELLCENILNKNYLNYFLFFSSKCSTDLCEKSLPTSAIILTENVDKYRVDLFMQRNYSNQILIGESIEDRVKIT